MSYKFIRTNEEHCKYSEVTVEIPRNDVCLCDLLEAFQDFLKGCGFHFNGEVDIIELPEYEVELEKEETEN